MSHDHLKFIKKRKRNIWHVKVCEQIKKTSPFAPRQKCIGTTGKKFILSNYLPPNKSITCILRVRRKYKKLTAFRSNFNSAIQLFSIIYIALIIFSFGKKCK